ncbi:hypothetical protein LTR28_004478 [Elasticomyces elasticus]|nr:hypothetical protein LTR28_004478 [Elasticomyces elasticus]
MAEEIGNTAAKRGEFAAETISISRELRSEDNTHRYRRNKKVMGADEAAERYNKRKRFYDDSDDDEEKSTEESERLLKKFRANKDNNKDKTTTIFRNFDNRVGSRSSDSGSSSNAGTSVDFTKLQRTGRERKFCFTV